MKFSYAGAPETEPVSIERVMDGDTFRLSNGQKLKLAGVKTAELHDTPKLPQEARRFNKEIWAFRSLGGQAENLAQHLVKGAQKQLLIDTGTQGVDEEGNLLGYVYIPISKLESEMTADGETIIEKDGGYQIFLNAYLLKIGLAELEPSSLDPKYKELFLKLNEEAKKNKKGLWA